MAEQPKQTLENVSEADARKLAYLAALVALETPKRRGKHIFNASVRWSLVEEIRAALIAAGFDYETARQHMEELTARHPPPEKPTT